MRVEVSPAIQATESADPALAMYSPVLGNGCGIKSWGVGTCTIAENTKLEGKMLNTLFCDELATPICSPNANAPMEVGAVIGNGIRNAKVLRSILVIVFSSVPATHATGAPTEGR